MEIRRVKKLLDKMKKEKVLVFPKIIGIETTAYCNAACPFCPFHGTDSDMTRSKGSMSMKLFKKIIIELKQYQRYIDTIYLNVCGEPLLDPDFVPRLDIIKESGLCDKVNIQTNGQFLTDYHTASILDANIGHLTLGFDGASEEVYKKHRVNCDYDLVIKNMKHFIDQRNRLNANTKVVIKFVETLDNRHETEAAHIMWDEILTPKIDLFTVSSSENWATERIDEGGIVLKTVKNSKRKHKPCPLIFETINIFHDGRVPVCCWDYNLDIVGDVGDVNKQSLYDIWHGKV